MEIPNSEESVKEETKIPETKMPVEQPSPNE
jgi:hypothetical protein